MILTDVMVADVCRLQREHASAEEEIFQMAFEFSCFR